MNNNTVRLWTTLAAPILTLALTLAPAADGVAAPGKYVMMASQSSTPDRTAPRQKHFPGRRVGRYTGLAGFEVLTYRPDRRQGPKVVAFKLINDGSPRINPTGVGHRRAGRPRNGNPTRSFLFNFPDRARQDMHLLVTDDVARSGRYSHDNMFRELAFFPRVMLPSIKATADGNRYLVTLPTGEPVVFDRRSREIVAGVLREDKPMDRNPNRHLRDYPAVSYRGQYLVISSEQRGDSTRNARVWKQRRNAVIRYPAGGYKPCRVGREELWDQHPFPGDRDPRLTMRFSDDEALYRFIESRCGGWDLSKLRRNRPAPPRLLVASAPAAAAAPASPPPKKADPEQQPAASSSALSQFFKDAWILK